MLEKIPSIREFLFLLTMLRISGLFLYIVSSGPRDLTLTSTRLAVYPKGRIVEGTSASTRQILFCVCHVLSFLSNLLEKNKINIYISDITLNQIQLSVKSVSWNEMRTNNCITSNFTYIEITSSLISAFSAFCTNDDRSDFGHFFPSSFSNIFAMPSNVSSRLRGCAIFT